MSKYLGALKNARPEHLYVFDLDRTDLNGGTVTDVGYNPLNLTVVEAAGFAEVSVTEPLIDGMSRSNHPSVLHERGPDTGSHATFEAPTALGARYFGTNMPDSWSIELVGRPSPYCRGRNGEAGALIALNQTSVGGLMVNYDLSVPESPKVRFEYKVDLVGAAGTVVLQSSVHEVDDTVFHLVLSKINDRYSLTINGKIDGKGLAGADYTALASNTVKIGGWDDLYHADTTIQSVAFFDRAVSSEEAKTRYKKLQFSETYEPVVESMDPNVNVFFRNDGKGTLQPHIESLSIGTNSSDVYEDENGHLSIQPSELAVGVTKYKKQEYDLSSLTAGVSVAFDVVKTETANSSIVTEYSFDDTTYYTFAEGNDTIPELDANWGGVV